MHCQVFGFVMLLFCGGRNTPPNSVLEDHLLTYWIWNCHIKIWSALWLSISFTFLPRLSFHIHLSKPTSHEWLMDLQLCRAVPPQPAPGCVYTSSFFLRLLSSSWSEYVWELGGPAAESPELQAGPDFSPSLSSSGSPQPGIQCCGLAVLRWPAEAEKCHQSGKGCWGQGQYSKGLGGCSAVQCRNVLECSIYLWCIALKPTFKAQSASSFSPVTRDPHAPQLFYPRQNQRWQKYSVQVWILVSRKKNILW